MSRNTLAKACLHIERSSSLSPSFTYAQSFPVLDVIEPALYLCIVQGPVEAKKASSLDNIYMYIDVHVHA